MLKVKKSKIFLLNNYGEVLINGDRKRVVRGIESTFEKNRSIVVLNEVLYMKRVYNKLDISIEKVINESFGNCNEYLFHYFYMNHNKEIVIYAIKAGNNVRILSRNAKNLEVRPIQIIIIDDFSKLINSKNWNLLFFYNNMYYFIKYKEMIIEVTFVEEKLEALLLKINNNKICEEVYIDSNIDIDCKDELNEIKFIAIDIGELLSEKRLFKEGFLTRSICCRKFIKS